MASSRAGAKKLAQTRKSSAARTKATGTESPRSFADAIHGHIAAIGSTDWIEVYRRGNGEQDFVAIVTVLIPENEARQFLSKEDWGIDPRMLRPGCTKYGDGSVTYDRFGTNEGFEPLVIERDFHEIKPAAVEIQEEFRLFHNLYLDQKNRKFFKINKDGSEQEVVRLGVAQVSIRALEIRQFLAVKRMRLAVLFDIRRGYSESLEQFKAKAEYEAVEGADFRYRRAVEKDASGKGCFVRMHGKKLILGFDVKDSGIWPFNEASDVRAFPSFIVGADIRGKEVLLLCNPHGGNYLKPVALCSNFSTLVLQMALKVAD